MHGIGKNSISQEFSSSTPSFERVLQKETMFGHRNYSGCVCQIEVGYNPAYSIV